MPPAGSGSPATGTAASPPADTGRGRVGPAADRVLHATLAVAAVVRFWAIGAQSFWYDETVTAEVARSSLTGLLGSVARREGTPPLYYVVAYVWHNVFGDSDVSLRLPSALAGIATVAVAYWLVVELGAGRRAARVAAVLTAVNPLLVWYSQEARAYALFVLVEAVAVVLFVRALRTGDRRHLLLWAVAAAAAIGTHYFAVLFTLVQGAVLLTRRPHERRDVVLAGLAPAVTTVLVFVLALVQRSTGQQSWIADFTVRLRLELALRELLGGPSPFHGALWVPAAVVALVGIVAVVVAGGRRARKGASLLAVVALGPVGLALVGTALGFDYFLGRNVLPSAFFGLVVVAIGLGATPWRSLATGAVAVVAAVWVAGIVAVGTVDELQKPDWRAAAELARSDDLRGRAVVVQDQPALGRPLVRYVDDREAEILTDDEETVVTEIDVVTYTPPDRPCDWFIGTSCAMWGPSFPYLPAELVRHFELVDEVSSEGFTVTRYRSARPVRIDEHAVVNPMSGEQALLVGRAAP